MGLFSTKPIVEKKEQWMAAMPPQEALDTLASAFASRGEDVRREKSSVEVHVGSSKLYRTLGNMSAEGRANIPVALTFTVSGTGTAVSVHAFDTFGFRLGSGKSFGVPETFNRRLEEFLSYAAGVIGIDRPVTGPVPAPPRF